MTESHLKVLHLDDDALYLEQFAATLATAQRSLGMAITTRSVDTVDAYLAALDDAPDIAVLDVNIGGALRGQEVAAATKARHPRCVVFMCSDMRGIGLVGACLGSGADDFIFKGTDERELALRLYGTWKLRAGATISEVLLPGAVGATMEGVSSRLRRLGTSAVTAVHVRGESGAGKELVSEMLAATLPKGTPFTRVNCGAIAPTLLESELFGHVKGAFTGATADKMGLVEASDGGWIFLDEVASLSSAAQVALLRTLENRTIRRVGGTAERKVKVRVLSATNEPMEQLVQAGRFRGDLWQRLCEAVIELPPLRERMDEFDGLVRHFCRTMDGGPYEISVSALGILRSYDWHEGNVRELRNCLRAMTELVVGKLLTPLAVPKWFWEKSEMSESADVAQDPTSSEPQRAPLAGSDEVRLSWPSGAPPPFERLTGLLLLEIIRKEVANRGKVSVRHLARLTSIPKSTLSSRLRQLVDQGLVEPAELGRLVNVGKE